METATPGVKSTERRLAEPLSAGARAPKRPAPFRAVALTQQLPRMLQGAAPALAMNQIDQFGIRGGGDRTLSASFEAQYAAAADQVLNGAGREAFDAMKTLKTADPARYQPENGADYPRSPFGQALRQIAQLTKADVGSRSRSPTSAAGTRTSIRERRRASSRTRLDDFSPQHRGARHRPRRSHGRHRRRRRCRSSGAR